MKQNYSSTVNLPQTKFPMKANLPVREQDIISFWSNIDVYSKMCQNNREKEKFVFHDGPPYANGHIHMGHALNKVLKDIIVKYKSMKGHYTYFIPGWDCHGLPIEYQLFKELKVNKSEINILDFRKKAKEFAEKFASVQKDEFIRLGTFADWENPYLTMTPEYELGIVHVFKELVKAGYIYRAKKPIYWCMYCETALAEAEVEYADHISPSIYVKFPVVNLPESLKSLSAPSLSVVIWTTTPWTLPANVALAFHPEYEYVVLECDSGDGKKENLIFAKALLENVTNKLGIKNYKILKTLKGKELEKIKCKNPVVDRESVGILAEFVQLDEGSGVVHIAPGHGQEDYQIGLKYRLPVLSPVNEKGIFTEEVSEFSGHKVFAANELIVNKLKENSLLLFEEKVSHSYPHCWRCKHAIIFRATEQWFMSVEHNNLRNRLCESIKKVKWVPEYGENRITSMVELRPDWCLSRQRYWGVPIPAVYCSKCGKSMLNLEIIEKFEKFISKESTDAWYIHPVEDFIPAGLKCSCGNNEFRKENDILDVWFDSGSSHEAVLKSRQGVNWPSDMYLEGSDQHRGWFQTSLITAVALYDRAPYNIVLTHGFIVDGEGKKMSKSTGNVVAPQEIIKKYGADILRLWVSASDYSEDIRISNEIVERIVESYRKIRNTIRYLLANLHEFDCSKDKISYSDLMEIDRWMLHRGQKLIEKVNNAYDNYAFHTVVFEINNFCVLDLSGFYLDILKDRLYVFKKKSKERLSAQTTLFEILHTLLRLIAPVLSFTAEESWQYLKELTDGEKYNKDDSVFFNGFPLVNKSMIDSGLDSKWTEIVQVREKVYNALEQARKNGLIHSSLEAKVKLTVHDKELHQLLKKYEDMPMGTNLKTVFIVSQIELNLDANLKDTAVSIDHADGEKCERCWNWSVDVDSAGLCGRCRNILETKA